MPQNWCKQDRDKNLETAHGNRSLHASLLQGKKALRGRHHRVGGQKGGWQTNLRLSALGHWMLPFGLPSCGPCTRELIEVRFKATSKNQKTLAIQANGIILDI